MRYGFHFSATTGVSEEKCSLTCRVSYEGVSNHETLAIWHRYYCLACGMESGSIRELLASLWDMFTGGLYRTR